MAISATALAAARSALDRESPLHARRHSVAGFAPIAGGPMRREPRISDFAAQRCKDRAKPAAVKAKYARPSHRLGRREWAHAVASGLVRCARGEACKWAEWVDGELVGGFIQPGTAWDIGTPRWRERRRPRARELQSSRSVPAASAATVTCSRTVAIVARLDPSGRLDLVGTPEERHRLGVLRALLGR